MFLQDYFEHLELEGSKHSPVLLCKEMLYKAFHSYKKVLQKDEYEDLQTDILIIAIEAERDYDPLYGTSFSTHLHNRLQALSNDFLTKYTGIKVTPHMRQVVFKDQKIYINKVEFKGEW